MLLVASGGVAVACGGVAASRCFGCCFSLASAAVGETGGEMVIKRFDCPVGVSGGSGGPTTAKGDMGGELKALVGELRVVKLVVVTIASGSGGVFGF